MLHLILATEGIDSLINSEIYNGSIIDGDNITR